MDHVLLVVDGLLRGEGLSDDVLPILVDYLHGTWNEVVEFAVDLDEWFSSP